MANSKDLKLEDIISYCKKNHEVAWLKAEVDKTVTNKKGVTGPISLFAVKANFVKRFPDDFKEYLPKAKSKKSSWRDEIKALIEE